MNTEHVPSRKIHGPTSPELIGYLCRLAESAETASPIVVDESLAARDDYQEGARKAAEFLDKMHREVPKKEWFR